MLKRAFTIAGLVIAGTIVPLATATPASATVAQCTGVLHANGYQVGAKATTACSYPATKTPFGLTPHWQCLSGLQVIGVSQSDSYTACSWA